MKIIILGAGQVGSSLAASLVSEDNDITVVDTDAARLACLRDRYELQTLVGHAAHHRDGEEPLPRVSRDHGRLHPRDAAVDVVPELRGGQLRLDRRRHQDDAHAGDLPAGAARDVEADPPGDDAVGPAGNFSPLTDFQTWVCSFSMLAGQLELFTLFVLFTPRFWAK